MRKYFRTSYLPNEILWGHRFERMQLYRKDNNKFEINFSAFHSTYEVDTPLYSARQMYQLERQREMEIKQVNTFLLKPENFIVNCQMENMLKGVMGNGRDTINNHSGTPSIM